MRKVKSIAWMCLAVLLLGGIGLVGVARVSKEVRYVRKLSSQVAKVIRTEDAAIKTREIENLLDIHLDYREFEERVLVDAHGSFSETDRTTFSILLRKVINKRILDNLVAQKQANECDDFSVRGTERALVVMVSCERGDEVNSVSVHLTQKEDRFRICDATLSGSLLSDNYRKSINKMIERKGIPGLLDSLKKSLLSKSEIFLGNSS